MSHPLLHPAHVALMEAQAAAPPAPTWPSYTGKSTFVGTSASKVSIWYDASLGAPGLKNATDLLADADRVRAANDAMFGTTGGPVNVLVWALNGPTDGTGGADHASCDYTTGGNIEVDASFGDSMRCSALFEAELSECSMGGNLCGLETGEALSRWCAAWIGNNALADFASVPSWDQAGQPNWVNKTQQSDQDYPSIGCGMAFLSWLQMLRNPMPNPINVIAPAMVALGNAGTLEQLYASLTGDVAANAWTKFKAACATVPLTTDDPFGALAGSQPAPGPTPGEPSGSITLAGVVGKAMQLALSGPVVSGAIHLSGTLTGGMLGRNSKNVVVSGAFSS